MGMLDKRLKRMEERVIKNIPKSDYQNLPDIPRAVVRPSQAQAQIQHSPRSSIDVKKRSAQEAFGPDLDQWSEPKQYSSHHTGASQYPKPKASAYDERTLLSEGRNRLPPLHIQQHLAETYFEYVYGQSYHLLHKPSFMTKLAAGNIPPVLILAVCAISARFSNHEEVKKDPPFLRGEHWSDAAREIAQRRFDFPNITILIVLLLLGLHEFGTCQGGRSWMLGGMAHRMAYALQLHKDLEYDPCAGRTGERLSTTDREIRRRTMWACFLMDRFNSSGTQRPMFASEPSLELQLPLKESMFEQELSGLTETLHNAEAKDPSMTPDEAHKRQDSMGVAAYMIRVIALWGRIVQYVNLGDRERDQYPVWHDDSGWRQLVISAQSFFDTLPDSMKYCEANLKVHDSNREANQFIYLHIVFHQCVLFLNRHALPPKPSPHGESPKEFVMKSHEQSAGAAENLSILLEKAKEYRVVAPFAGFCAYMSSTVQVRTAFSSNKDVQQRAKKNLRTNVGYLDYMKAYWGNFYFLSDNLKLVYRRWLDVASKPGTATPDLRAEDSQYGDWYDRYPHGVFRDDYEEPKPHVKKEPGEDAALGERADSRTVEQFLSKLSPSSKARLPLTKSADKRQPPAGKRSRRNTASKPLRQSQATSEDASSRNPHGHGFESMDIQEATNGFPESYDRSPLVPQHPMHMSTHSQVLQAPTSPAQQYDPGQVLPTPYNYLTDHDQPMAYPPFTAFDTSGMPVPGMTNGMWDYQSVNEDFWNEPHNAWFAPFNLNPPEYQSQQDSGMSDANVMMGMQDPSLSQGGSFIDNSQMSNLNMNPGDNNDG